MQVRIQWKYDTEKRERNDNLNYVAEHRSKEKKAG